MFGNYFQGFPFIDSWTTPMATDMTDKILLLFFCVFVRK